MNCCQTDLFLGVAGTEKQLYLQDPVHWYTLKKANSEVKRILKAEMGKEESTRGVMKKLVKRVKERAAENERKKLRKQMKGALNSEEKDREKQTGGVKREPKASPSKRFQIFRKRGEEESEKQRKINDEIKHRSEQLASLRNIVQWLLLSYWSDVDVEFDLLQEDDAEGCVDP